MKPIFATASAVLALSVLAPLAANACATCGCSLNSDAVTGYSNGPGWRVDLQYSYIDQSQLRSGSHAVSTPEVAAINDKGGDQEVEKNTTNRYATLGVTYSPSYDWNFNLQIPYVDRSHSTYSNATTDQLTQANVSGVSFGQLGDVKMIATYQGLLQNNHLGIQAGIKLPTGNYGNQNVATGAQVGRNPVYFKSGPNEAAGQALDASLQPGTGSTDLLIGAYYVEPISDDFEAFITGRFQVSALEALDGVNANYRPGNLTTVSAGIRYEYWESWAPQLQVNFTHKGADQGALADLTNSSGNVVYLSPGLSVNLDHGLRIYGFVQLPVYSDLIGYQLFPRWTGNGGISYSF